MPVLEPNGLVSSPQESWIWLAPDWSDYAASAGQSDRKAPQPGWTHVKVRETRYNDGRVVTQVLDENNSPVSDASGPRPPLETSTDAKQAGIFNTQAGDTTVPGMQQRVQINPATGQPEMATIYPNNPAVSYGPATAAQLAQAGYTGRTEGTPLPGGGFDNEQPVWVVRGPNNAMVGQPRALTDDERKAWNLSRQRSRNPGGLTDAELPASKREPVKDHPGYSIVSTASPQNPNAVETHYEKDGAPGVAVQLPPAQAPSRTNPTNNHFEELDPQTGQWIDRGLVAKPPVIRQNPVTGTDEQVQEVPDGAGGTKLVVKPIERVGSNPATPSDAPNIDLSDPKRAYDSFMQLYQWAASKVARGEQTPTWLENVLKGPHAAVTTVLDREKELQRRTEQQQSNQLTQRSQDVSLSGNRLSNATTGFGQALTSANETNRLAGPGINAAASTLLGTLALQRINAQQMGGLSDIAPVIPGPLAAPGAALPGGLPPGPAAVGPVSSGVAATTAAAMNPTGPNVQAATGATMAGANAAFGGLGIGPGAATPSPLTPPGLAPPGTPQSSILPNVGPTPTMAMLSSSMGGGNPYAYALDALRRLGIGEDDLMAAHHSFLNG